MIIIKVFVFFIGLFIVGVTLSSAIRTFILPRSARDKISRLVFLFIRRLFNYRVKQENTYLGRDRIMAFSVPISLLALQVVWLVMVMLGYMAMYWAVGVVSWREENAPEPFALKRAPH